MIAVDTNVVVRFLTRDDPLQFQRAVELFQSGPIYVPDTVVLETEWVLRHAYHFPPDQVRSALKGLLGLPNVTVADPHRLSSALEWHAQGLDFADALHLASSAGDCEALATFDMRFVQRAAGLSRCVVRQP